MYMTFWTTKTMEHSKESQAGVSLMLAVLVLAAITAIAFSLATIVFIEIKSSGDASRTEPALYATLGVTEEALFQYKRFYTPTAKGDFDTAACEGPTGSNPCLLNGVTLTLPGTQPLDFDNSPRVEFVGAGTNRTIPLYTQGDDDGDDWNKVYDRVGIEVLPNASSSSISAYFVLTNEDGTTSNTAPVSVSPGSLYEYQGFISTGQYELILSNPSSVQDLSVKISTVRVGNAQPDGLPFVGEQVFRIFADYLGLTRTYQVKIPLLGTGGGDGNTVNYAASANGGVASASSTYSSSYPESSAINGDRTGSVWGGGTGGWNDSNGSLPNWLQVNFSGTQNISEINVYTLANAYPTTPDATTPADSYGIMDFQMQYWNGSSWVTVSGGNITGNTLAWRQVTFPTISTDRIRVYVTAHRAGYSRIVEVEAY
jgi:hypothetical protein